MLRGEIWLCDLEPAVGHEANKSRPCIIVSNDDVNASAARRGRGVVTVVPITSSLRRVYRFQVELPATDTRLTLDAKAQCEQVRSVATERLRRRLGMVPLHLMTQVDAALRLHPGL